MVDLMARAPHLPQAGETVKGDGFLIGPGDKGSNQGVAAHKAGAEVDMVMNVGALKSGEPRRVEDDIRVVVEHCDGKALVKVILECCLLSDSEKVDACGIAVAAGADFVKTSTGFGSGGATAHDVKLMKDAVSGRARVKASGGIRDLQTAIEMIDAGADRLGTSNGASIVDEARRRGV